MSPTLAVLIPIYNEEANLTDLLDAVERQPEVSEIVIVDDASSDRTPEILAARDFKLPVQLLRHPANRGKGAAIRTAIDAATSEFAVIQDADLEYDPRDYPVLLEPFHRPGVTVVYGSRSFSAHSAYSFWFVMGNKLVTLFTNVLFNSYISDMETCYKMMPLSLWRALDLRADRFDIEPEITGKLLRGGHRIYEVPISYAARSREEGKKLTWRDGVYALFTLTRIRIRPRPALPRRTPALDDAPKPVR
jgi:glycosyltransferase involved in cell wall biosynthesis